MKALLTAGAVAAIGAIVGLSAVTGSVDAASTPADTSLSSEPTSPGAKVWTFKEKKVLKLHNKARANAGLGALASTKALGKAAGTRCTEIISKFSHTRPNGTTWSTVLAQFGISYSIGGENIAYGYSTPASVHKAWMNSSGHRANILRSSFKNAGVGHCTSSGGTSHWVVLFTG